ncbi:hypothetical protein ACHAXT_006527 [Thalassiosira profunda]
MADGGDPYVGDPAQGARLVPNRDGSLPSVHVARDYVAHVKLVLGPDSERYRTFLSSLRGYRTGVLTPQEVIGRMRNIFGRNRELILGFNAFLPAEFRIVEPGVPAVVPMDEEEDGPPVVHSPARAKKRKGAKKEEGDMNDEDSNRVTTSHHKRKRRDAPQDPDPPKRKRLRVRAKSDAPRSNIKFTSAPSNTARFASKRRINANTQIILSPPAVGPLDMVHEYAPGRDGEYAYEMHTDHVDCKLCKGKRDSVATATHEPVLLCEQRGCNAEYHLGCLYDHDPPLFPQKKESGDAPGPVPNEGGAGGGSNGGEAPSQYEVPDGDIFCAKCAEEGSTAVLEKYFDKVDYDRSHYSCSRAYVCAMLEKHMKANPSGNIVERSLAQAKAGIAEVRLRPSPRSELWYATELTARALQIEGAAHKAPPMDDTAECLVGKPVRLYNSLDDEYHLGRIVDFRACTAYPPLYGVGDGPPVTKNNTVQMRDLEYYGTSSLSTSEVLVRFPAGLQGRKKQLLRWIVLEEHSLAVGVSLIQGQTSKLRGVTHEKWKPAMILARSALELVTVRQFLHEDEEGALFANMRLGGSERDATRPDDRWALTSFFGEEQHALLRLRDEARDLLVDVVNEEENAANGAVDSGADKPGEAKTPSADNPQAFGSEDEKPAAETEPPRRELLADVDVPLGLALAERAEQKRCVRWSRFLLQKSNHERALVSSDEHSTQIWLESDGKAVGYAPAEDEGEVDDSSVDADTTAVTDSSEATTSVQPLVERGMDRMWLAQLVEKAASRPMPLCKDSITGIKFKPVTSVPKAIASLQRR